MAIPWVELMIFVMAVIVHELGHILHYWILKKEWPKIKVSWYGAIQPQITDQITVYQKISNIYYAVVFGLIVCLAPYPFIAYDLSLVLLAYIFACLIDMFILIALIYLQIKHGSDKHLSELKDG